MQVIIRTSPSDSATQHTNAVRAISDSMPHVAIRKRTTTAATRPACVRKVQVDSGPYEAGGPPMRQLYACIDIPSHPLHIY